MGRPIGSKNKPKEAEVKFSKKSDVLPPVKFQVSPDMGAIKPPVKELALCECGGPQKSHYGGEKGWCNDYGCACPQFREKASK